MSERALGTMQLLKDFQLDEQGSNNNNGTEIRGEKHATTTTTQMVIVKG